MLFLKKIIESNKLVTLMAISSVKIIAVTLYLIFCELPDDYLQGSLVKIMYVHVPFAWMSIILYAVCAVCSMIYVLKKIVIFDIISENAAYISLYLIAITLATGSIWGKPAWGTWWIWDARLTSMLILFFIVLSYTFVRKLYERTELSSNVSSVIAIVGFINVPIIKFSVDIWSTLHQKSSFFKLDGPSVHASMLYPMIMMFTGIVLLVVSTIIARVHLSILTRKMERHKLVR